MSTFGTFFGGAAVCFVLCVLCQTGGENSLAKQLMEQAKVEDPAKVKVREGVSNRRMHA